MKASELMIGDIVRSTFASYPVGIICLKSENAYGWVKTTEDFGVSWKSDASLTPIPLTEEILKANGWRVLSNFDRDTYYSEHGEFNLDFHNGDFRLIINSHVVIIKYVHQLQRILRCCNLYELADNFKLKKVVNNEK